MRVSVNIMTPGCMVVPSLHNRSMTPQRPMSPPPYSLCYSSTSSPISSPITIPERSRSRTPVSPSRQSASPNPDENGLGEIIGTSCHNTPPKSPNPQEGNEDECPSEGIITDPTPGTSACIHNTEMTPSLEIPLGETQFWQHIQCEMTREVLKFCVDIMTHIITYGELHDFAIRCDIPTHWVERAKEDNPHDSELMVSKVFFEWWGRSNLNIGKKLQMIQEAFDYMGNPWFSTESF